MFSQTDLFSFCSIEPPSCKRCGSFNIKKNGKYRKQKRKQTYECKRCGCKFVFNQSDLEKMKFHSRVISFAVDLYTNTGIALRTIARKLKEYFSVIVSHVTVRNWCKKASQCIHIPRLSDLNARLWCIDETQVKVNGEHVWLWVVFDPENKVVINWHVSKLRTMKDAVILLKNAFQRTGCLLWQIITDELPLYRRAIKTALGKKGHTRVEHCQVTGKLKRNNYIERLFKEVKRRTKWFSSFRAYNTIPDFFNVFFYCYNHNKYHRTIGRIPLEQKTIREALKTLPT